MGRIVAPYGVLGWLKIMPSTQELNGLALYKTWWVGKEEDWRKVKLKSSKLHNNVLVAKLEGLNDRDAALACKGLQVAVSRELLPKPDQDEYYWSDLIDLNVKNQQGVDFGQIIDVFETGANDVLVVKGEVERLIPFIAQNIIEVSLEQQTMLVDWDGDF